MKFLFIDINQRVGNIDTPHYAVQRLMEELDKLDIPHQFTTYDNIHILVEDSKPLILADTTPRSAIEWDYTPLEEFTHIIIRGHRTNEEYMLKHYIVAYAEKHGIIVQNAEFIKLFPHYNKLIQMTMFADAGLPYLDSYYNIDGRYWEKDSALERLGFPLIYKHISGEYRIEMVDGKPKTKKNVFLAQDKDELTSLCEKRDRPEEKFLTKPSQFFIQQYADIGTDYRAIMIGDEYLSGWKREATKNFLTVSKGSEYSLYDKPADDLLELAQKTARLVKADYCAVDIIYVNDVPHILEINMNPGFKAFETKLADCEVNVAKAMVDQMLRK